MVKKQDLSFILREIRGAITSAYIFPESQMAGKPVEGKYLIMNFYNDGRIEYHFQRNTQTNEVRREVVVWKDGGKTGYDYWELTPSNISFLESRTRNVMAFGSSFADGSSRIVF